MLFSRLKEFPGDTRGGYCDICQNFVFNNTIYGWVLVSFGRLYVNLYIRNCRG